ncbi:alpha/beta hydrolase-fold protein [uncultured Croceitalea sp.]|uniref:alpha/beta hydrolase n=1 Tax=uncultured Croceitalea sp. TaxID=1798908 RepID=UPI00330658B8
MKYIKIIIALTITTSLYSQADIVIGKEISLFSEVLNEERKLLISLPQNYARDNYTYPVILVMDGEYLFEITNSIVKIKVSRNEMPASIIVGIPNNTAKRYDMALKLSKSNGQNFFGNNEGNTQKYLSFLREELFPFLKKNYRINTHRTIIGMSPTFGPVLEAFWNQPDLFRGYIVLAAELSLKTISGKSVSDKVLEAVQNKERQSASLYIGKAGKDLERRPVNEAEAFITLNHKLDSIANPKINYKIEILENKNHYGMSIAGIEHGLGTMYPFEIWDIPYRDFWNSENPANKMKSFYEQLSNRYGFEIRPLEDSFYFSQTLLGTIRRLERQKQKRELKDVIELGLKYYPNSIELKRIKSTIKNF